APSPRRGEGRGEGLSESPSRFRATLTRLASLATLSPKGRGYRVRGQALCSALTMVDRAERQFISAPSRSSRPTFHGMNVPHISPREFFSKPSAHRGDAPLRSGELGVALDRQRPADEEALQLVAAFLDQNVALLRGLDAFGDHRKGEAVGEADHGAHDRDRVVALLEIADELAVYLDEIERERLQVRQRRIAGTEVVERD